MPELTRRSIRACGVIGVVFSALLITVLGYGAGRLAPAAVPAYTTSYNYRTLHDPLELLLVQSDGQAFASLARDPTLARPEIFRTPGEMAYRAQRPVLGYLAWLLSLGRTGWVPPALAVLASLGAGLATSGIARLLADRYASPYFSLLILLLPGMYMSLSYCGPEPFGLGLVAWGLHRWSREKPWSALALFAVAGLCRETLLIVPIGLAAYALIRHRRRTTALLSIAGLPYLIWIGFLRLRVGAFPWDARNGRLDLPFVGIAQGLARTAASGTTMYALLTAVMAALALALVSDGQMRAVLIAHLAAATILGDGVWIVWNAFGRILLPLHALALVAIIATVTGSPPPAVETPLSTRSASTARA